MTSVSHTYRRPGGAERGALTQAVVRVEAAAGPLNLPVEQWRQVFVAMTRRGWDTP